MTRTPASASGPSAEGGSTADRGAALVPYGRALHDYHFHGKRDAMLGVHTSLGDHEEVPIALFFRDEDALLPWEMHALELARGRVLDVGAGAGVHSLILQAMGRSVTAVDLVGEAVEVMRDRGVADVRQGDVLSLESEPFDTVLMLMNGLGTAGTVAGLVRLLERASRLVAPGGQLLADSAEPLREPRGGGPSRQGEAWPEEEGAYPGEAWIRFEYEGVRAPPCRELYMDAETLARRAAETGWHVQIAFEGEEGLYLARLVRP